MDVYTDESDDTISIHDDTQSIYSYDSDDYNQDTLNIFPLENGRPEIQGRQATPWKELKERYRLSYVPKGDF